MEFNKHSRPIAFAVLGLVVALQVNTALAQSSSSPSNFKYHDLPNGQRVIVPYNSPLPSAAQQAGQQVWNQAIANTASGNVQVGRSISLPNPNGTGVPASARGRLPPAQVAASVGRAIAATAKTIGPIGIGLAVYDLAKELGFTLERKPDGTVSVVKESPPGTADSYRHGYLAPSSTRSGACEIYVQYYYDFNAHLFESITSKGLNGTICSAVFQQKDGNIYNVPSDTATFTAGSTSAPSSPSSIQALTDAVAAKSGWPATSKINDVVLADPQQDQQVPVDIVASGPASSPGPKSTTTNTTNNTTSNSTTTYNHVYQGDTISTTVSVVNVTTNNSTGAITNTEISTSTPATEKLPPPACPPGSTELNCASLDVPEDTIPKVTKDVTYQAESMFGGGACPADVSIVQATTGRPIKLSFTPTCNALANYVKPVIIAIALFMAYLIILPGRND